MVGEVLSDMHSLAPVVLFRCGKGNRITLLPTSVGSLVGYVDRDAMLQISDDILTPNDRG